MKKPRAGDVVLTYKINLGEIARSQDEQFKLKDDPDCFHEALLVLQANLKCIRENPSVVARGVYINGVECGLVKLDWKVAEK